MAALQSVMRLGVHISFLATLLCAACVPVRPETVATQPPAAAPTVAKQADAAHPGTAPSDAAHDDPAPPDATGGIDPVREEFETKVRPILEKRCTPCHFPGGKMYDRLPFDRPGTIRVLGTALFTRIHDPEERATISAFLGVPNEALPEPP